MTSTPRITVIVGSLRRGSIARKIAHEVLTMIPKDYEANILEIRNLPLYDFDYDDPAVTDRPTPSAYTTFRDTIKNSSGVLFITPENNRTIPACLKTRWTSVLNPTQMWLGRTFPQESSATP